MPFVDYNKQFDKNPEQRLLYAIILSAFQDKDVKWLKSKVCKHYCSLLDIPYSYILRRII